MLHCQLRLLAGSFFLIFTTSINPHVTKPKIASIHMLCVAETDDEARRIGYSLAMQRRHLLVAAESKVLRAGSRAAR
jgi:hypothetical protein